MVGNLSTVSSSVRDFTILILGYYFAEKVAEVAGPGTELATFLKWEQLAAYSRAQENHDTSFRGTERVQRNLKEGNIILSADTSHQILSNQKAYGIWGLYSWPGRASGLLEGQPAVLTLPARELVERVYLDALTQAGVSDGKRIIEILCADRTKLEPHRQSDKRLLEAVAGLLKDEVSPAEREFYRDHLLYGGENDSTERRQRQLAALIEPRLVDGMFAWTPAMVVRKQLIDEDLPKNQHRFESLLHSTVTDDVSVFDGLLEGHAKRIELKIKELNQQLRKIAFDRVEKTYIQLVSSRTDEVAAKEFRNLRRNALQDSLNETTEKGKLKERYHRIEQLLNKLDENPDWTNRVIDVRNWFNFRADESYQADNVYKQSYSGASAKSGGEKTGSLQPSSRPPLPTNTGSPWTINKPRPSASWLSMKCSAKPTTNFRNTSWSYSRNFTSSCLSSSRSMRKSTWSKNTWSATTSSPSGAPIRPCEP